MSSKKKSVPRNKLQADLKAVNKDFIKQFPGSTISRDFYRNNGEYGKGDLYTPYYPDFPAFRDATLGVEAPAAPISSKKSGSVDELPIDKRVEIEKEKISDRMATELG